MRLVGPGPRVLGHKVRAQMRLGPWGRTAWHATARLSPGVQFPPVLSKGLAAPLQASILRNRVGSVQTDQSGRVGRWCRPCMWG